MNDNALKKQWKETAVCSSGALSHFHLLLRLLSGSAHITCLRKMRKRRVCGLILPKTFSILYPFPKRQILDSSKLKELADVNFKFDENGRKFSKWVENAVGKGEIARYEQFLLFPQCFQNTCTTDT